MLTVFRVLHSVVVHRLGEIALLVKQSHRNEIGSPVTGGFAVVAGEDAEAAGVDREALVKAVLRAEIGHQGLVAARRRRGDISVERLQRATIAGNVNRIARGAVQARLRNAAQKQARITAGLLPELGVQILEQRSNRTVPGEEKIARQLRQTFKGFRDDGCDLEQRISHCGPASAFLRRMRPRSLAGQVTSAHRKTWTPRSRARLCAYVEASPEAGRQRTCAARRERGTRWDARARAAAASAERRPAGGLVARALPALEPGISSGAHPGSRAARCRSARIAA